MIVYEDEHVRVMWRNGFADFAIISFGDRISLADAERFFADRPVEKLGIPCLGVMAKSPNWFPSQSVRKALSAAEHLYRGYSSRVTYGGSMGGYAAVKYSSLAGATSVVAFCPQWSIDKDDCDGFDPGWTSHFEPWMSGMKITSREISGDVYLFSDPLEAKDNFHQAKILAAYPSAKLVKMFWCGHHVTNTLAGTDNLATLVSFVRKNEHAKVVQFVNQIRRRSRVREKMVLEAGSSRLPRTVSRILVNRGNDNYAAKIASDLARELTAELFYRGHTDEAREFFSMFYSQLSIEDKITIGLMAAVCDGAVEQPQVPATAIKSHENSLLAFNAVSGECVHVDLRDGKIPQAHFLVTCEIVGDKGWLFIEQKGRRIFLIPYANAGKVGISIEGFKKRDWNISFDLSGRIQFSHGGLFLCAGRNRAVIANRTIAGRWESFDLVST